MSAELAEHIRGLARRVRRLLPLNHDPEAFHIEKDAIAHELLILAGRYGPPRSEPRPSGRVVMKRQIVVGGRLVTVQHKRADFSI